jgi:branched-chain amino acid transport system substrate-binding protein
LVLGQSAALSGPSGQIGQDYREGALAWFAELNRRGGIHGRQIRLVSLDDRYEPELTLRNTERLLSEDGAFALFGYVGTPTVKAVLPLVERQRIPLVAPLTGATLLRQPTPATVINLRASYQAELNQIVDNLVRAGRHRIAVLHQLDAFGDDGLAATRRALARHGLQPLISAGIPRNGTSAGEVARRIHAANPSGVIVIAAYPSAAAFAREMQQRTSSAQLMHVSFVGTRGLEESLPAGQAHGIGIAQVVPFPWNRRIPVVAEYQRLMRRQHSEPRLGFNSLEGFLAAKLMGEALQRAGANPSREGLLEAFSRIGRIDLGGFTVTLGPGDRNASDLVELTFLGSQRWEP